jgi:FtsZ-binding cell division protein ZapB
VTAITLESLSDGRVKRAEEQSVAMRALQNELDELQEARAREQDRDARRARDDQQEIQSLRERCEGLQEEHENYQGVRFFPQFLFPTF